MNEYRLFLSKKSIHLCYLLVVEKIDFEKSNPNSFSF